ncbi:M56 family metallopeptidase [Flavobacterium sp. MAH-1]|uniref:M56 family metallopeptidase n=1 Tax=Flavobacterium agri TaxID=2743471 RepID=A0A7Y9C824_9FLAO|nr:M56 family metallopeptidase [Flavobacterium agri]NUY81948.1 M56 family metallopeptidase [Flavobacterium agri]NYA71972.1 M56 family metallopeptidase [Flavobacterium agri]
MTFPIENLMHAVSWTLVHSLWQGLLLAVGGWVLLVFTKKSSAKVRYDLFCSLLCLFVLGTILTFVWQMGLLSDGQVIPILSEPTSQTPNPFSGQVFTADMLQTTIGFINRNVFWIAVVWFGIFCIKCFGVFREFGALQRLRHYRTNTVPEYWSDRLEVFKTQIGIKQTILFLESGLTLVPCVIGFLRPVILVPIGLLASLPEDQVNAILLHELAHIKRRDFFMNLVQTFVDTLFFFNPAVFWLSSLIREERENCCDDLALSVSGDSPSLVRALLSVSERQQAGALYAAFIGRKTSILKRAQRILGVRTSMISTWEKSILTVSILCFAIGVVACTTDSERPAEQAEKVKNLPDDFKVYDATFRQNLISEGIIRDTVGLSYHLSEEDFVVNGKAQSAAMHHKFKSKFLIYKNMTATWYNWKFD